MSEELRLECLPSDQPEKAICFLCDEYFEPAGAVAILYDGDMPMGYLCSDCGAAPPQRAAARVRQRARRILALLKYGEEEGSAERQLKRLQLIRRRADYWKAFAKRLDQLDSWD